jgi:hypothetical protein
MHKKLLVILFSLLSFSAQAVEVLHQLNGQLKALDLKKVAACTAVIQKQMKKNKLARIGYATTLGAVVVVGGWGLFSGTLGRLFSNASPDLTLTNMNAKMDAGLYKLDVLSNTLPICNDVDYQNRLNGEKKIKEAKEKEAASFVLSAANFFQSWGRHLVDTALIGFFSSQMTGATNFALQPIFKAWDRVFHDANVQWYITEKTHTKRMFEELITLSDELVTAADDRERTVIINTLTHTGTGLVMEIEKLIAFMNYKRDLYEKEFPFAVSGMHMMTKNIIEEVNLFVTKAQEILAVPGKHAELSVLIRNFHKKLNAHKRGFIMYEECPEEVIV